MLVLDANILIRAVLGSRVLSLLRKYAGQVEFLAPDTAFEETRESLAAILDRRRIPVPPAMAILDQLTGLVRTVEAGTYQSFEHLARQRIARRDEADWPVLAAALASARLPHLDGRHRLLRLWRSDLDHGSGGVVFGEAGGATTMTAVPVAR